MPEKPEVMTVCSVLKKRIIGKTITDCNVYWNNIIATDLNSFKKNIINQKIHNINSRGKFIVIELDNYYLLIHLRMEGKFTFRDKGAELEKHEHVELILDNEISWRYRDVRKFGKMYLIEKDKLNDTPPIKNLGYDYYDKDDFYILMGRLKKASNYLIDPGERLADIRAWKYIVNLLKNQRTSDDLLVARSMLYYSYIRGYQHNRYYLDAPTYLYLIKMGMYHQYYLFKKRVEEQKNYSFETRLTYGLPLTEKEYDKSILRKVRLKKKDR